MPSKHYNALKRNIAKLASEFLNFEKRTDGGYTNSELLKCGAYIAFCHAEVEIYLEEMCSSIVAKAERQWVAYARNTRTVSALLTYRLSKDYALPNNPKDQSNATKLETLVGQVIANQRGIIRNNHGIKAKNIAQLFIPIGMNPDEIEESLLIQLDNLGTRRGDLVHSSSHVSLPNIRDPFDDEKKDIEFLLSELEQFDLLARSLS